MQHLRRHPRRLVRVVDAFAVERVDASGGVSDHEVRRTGLRAYGATHRDATAGGLAFGSVGRDLPAIGDLVRVRVEQVRGVDALELAKRRQQADTDVDRAVTDREDPAVAGHRIAVAILHVERGFDPRLGVTRCLPVGPDRRPVGPLACAERAERTAEAAVGAVGDDDVPGADLDGIASRRLHHSPANEPAIDDGLQRLVTLEQRCTGSNRVAGDHRVELPSANDVAVLRVHRVRRPLQLELTSHARGAQPVVLVELGELIAEPHFVQLVHGARCQPVAARLLARERLAFDDGDLMAVPGEPVGR